MASPPSDLREWIALLEREGELARVAAEVDPDLEITEIVDRTVKAGGPAAAARSLSGGNLQKFIVGREIDAGPKVFVVSQPTWGVDVGAAALIRGEILALRDAGCAVLVVSEELDELFEISDRLHVIAKGRISPPIERAAATVTQIGEWMSGLWDKSADAASLAKKEEGAHA